LLNKITCQGRLCAAPELKHTESGKAVTNFTLAVDRDHNRDETDFIDVVAWNGTAEFVSKYFRKGSMCIVSGRLQMRRYESKDGTNRTAYEIVADSVYFGESRRDGA
jgi:single-strand DNA-binding protein